MLTTSTSLLKGIGEGDSHAWGVFVDRYWRLLVNFARQLGLNDADADDAAQQTLIAVHQRFGHRGKFDRGRAPFRTWLWGVARKKIVDRFRERKRQRTLRGSGSDNTNGGYLEPVAEDAVERLWCEEYARHEVTRALSLVRQTLNPKRFQAFDLYFVQDLPVKEVCRVMGVNENFVFMSKCHALKVLREQLAHVAQEEL